MASVGGSGGSWGGNEHVNKNQYGSMGLSDYVMAQQFVDTIRMVTGAKYAKQFTYVRFGRKLKLHFPFQEGEVICFKVSENVDPEANPDFAEAFDDEFLKGLAVALCKQTWGEILGKYGSIELPGGVVLTGQEIFQHGKDEEKDLMDGIVNRVPLGFWMG